MTTGITHRIEFSDFDPELQGGFASIRPFKTLDMRMAAHRAAAVGLQEFILARLELFVVEWSLDCKPSDRKAIGEQRDDLLTFILQEAEDWYDRTTRSAEERKRAALAARESAQPE